MQTVWAFAPISKRFIKIAMAVCRSASEVIFTWLSDDA